jgi:hypothetical protein
MAKKIRMNEDLNAEFENMQNAASELIDLCEEIREYSDSLESSVTEIEDRATFLWELDDPNVDYNFANYTDEEKEKIIRYINKRLNFYISKLASLYNRLMGVYNHTDDVLSDIKQFDDSIGGDL